MPCIKWISYSTRNQIILNRYHSIVTNLANLQLWKYTQYMYHYTTSVLYPMNPKLINIFFISLGNNMSDNQLFILVYNWNSIPSCRSSINARLIGFSRDCALEISALEQLFTPITLWFLNFTPKRNILYSHWTVIRRICQIYVHRVYLFNPS